MFPCQASSDRKQIALAWQSKTHLPGSLCKEIALRDMSDTGSCVMQSGIVQASTEMGSHSLLHTVYSSVFEKRSGCLIGILSSDMKEKKRKQLIFLIQEDILLKTPMEIIDCKMNCVPLEIILFLLYFRVLLSDFLPGLDVFLLKL